MVAFLDPDSSGWVPYFEASTSMREVLLAIYSARAVEKRVSEGRVMEGRGRHWEVEEERGINTNNNYHA